jgi:hypothetical protein
MSCAEFDEQIQRLLDRRIAPEGQANLRRHARGCRRCGAVLAAYRQLLVGLQDFDVADLDDDFARSVVEQATAPVSRPAPQRRWAAYVAIALAASLLLAAMPLWRVNPRQTTLNPQLSTLNSQLSTLDPQFPPLNSQLSPLDPHPSTPNPHPSTLNSKPAPPPAAEPLPVRALWDTWYARWRPDGSRIWTFRPPPLTWDQWYDRWKQESRESIDPLADGFAPIATSLTVAIDGIRSAVPLGRDGSPPPAEPRSDSARDTGSPSSSRPVVVVG